MLGTSHHFPLVRRTTQLSRSVSLFEDLLLLDFVKLILLPAPMCRMDNVQSMTPLILHLFSRGFGGGLRFFLSMDSSFLVVNKNYRRRMD